MAQIADVIIKVITTSLDTAKKKLKDTTKESDKLSKSAKGMKAFTKAGIVGAAVVGIGAIATALANANKEAIAYADNIGKTAKKLGITTDELQRYRIVAEAAGISTTEFDTAFQRFSRRIGEVKRGTGELKKAFEEMGIDIKDQSGRVKSNTQLFKEFSTGIKNTKDHTVAMSLAMKGFDMAGAQMIEMLKTSDAEMARLNDTILEYGMILSAETIAKSEEAATTLGALNQAQKIMATEAALSMTPLVLKWTEWKTEILASAIAFAKIFNIIDRPLEEKIILAGAAYRKLKSDGAGYSESQLAFQERLSIKLNEYNKLIDELKNKSLKRMAVEKETSNITIKNIQQKIDWSAQYIKATDDATAADESFFSAVSKLDDEREQLRIGSITNEKSRITALEDFKKEKAFNEIELLKITEEQKQDLRDQYNENRVLRESNTLNKLNTKTKSSLELQADYYNNTNRVMSDLTVGWANNTASAITQMVMTGKADFKSLAQSIVSDIIKMIIQRQIFNAISDIFPGGGATSQGNQLGTGASVPVSTNARGGVISNNTQFGIGGRKVIAGEAGAEAILPLKRDRNGNLGVSSGSGGGSTNVNIEIINNSQAQIQQQTSTGANGEKIIRVMVEDAMNSMVQNGKMDKVMTPYGLTRRGVR